MMLLVLAGWLTAKTQYCPGLTFGLSPLQVITRRLECFGLSVALLRAQQRQVIFTGNLYLI